MHPKPKYETRSVVSALTLTDYVNNAQQNAFMEANQKLYNSFIHLPNRLIDYIKRKISPLETALEEGHIKVKEIYAEGGDRLERLYHNFTLSDTYEHLLNIYRNKFGTKHKAQKRKTRRGLGVSSGVGVGKKWVPRKGKNSKGVK